MKSGMRNVLAGLLFALLAAGAATAAAGPLKDSEEIIKHLQFLGYQTEMTEQSLKATHAKYINFALKDFAGGILFQGFFLGNEYSKQNRAAFLELANSLNEQSAVARAYVDKQGDLALEAWFPAAYEKERFGAFLDVWQDDTLNKLGQKKDDIQKFLQ